MKQNYYLYILECINKSYYTGITLDPDKRWQQHLDGVGAKYTRAFKPLRIAALWMLDESKSNALKIEYRIKRLSHKQKKSLIADPKNLEFLIADII